MSSGPPLSVPAKTAAPAEATHTSQPSITLSSTELEPRDDNENSRLLGKVADLLQRQAPHGQETPTNAAKLSRPSSPAGPALKIQPARSSTPWSEVSAASASASAHYQVPSNRVKETKHVSLEYDPSSRRKVLNTYEIIREIGRGEHGKVKLAKNLVNNELVAIKIVSRKSKDRSLRMRRPSQQYMDHYEAKIKREIAIMKRCDHRHIVRFKEVLDDRTSYKIYLVLEYMDRGEIKWKRQSPITSPRPLTHHNSKRSSSTSDEKLPCWSGQRRASVATQNSNSGNCVATEDNDLLSNEFSPNLTFRQSRRIFRDVLLGLEYLHMQGIVHRDIKPANLLVSSDYTVKISDFGVSFASSLGSTDDGIYFSEMELAKTVGTPAFFAPELCQTSIADTNSLSDEVGSIDSNHRTKENSPSLPRVDHKIDIWAMGVTLYCLLFGRVPFNADSEFALFEVIVNEKLQFPESRSSFFSPQEVTEEEFELAKDLLSKMLQKNSRKRIDIEEIKRHKFVLLDLENDPERLHEFYFLNSAYSQIGSNLTEYDSRDRSQNNSPTVGVAKRIGGSLLKAFNNESGSSNGTSPVNADNRHLPLENNQGRASKQKGEENLENFSPRATPSTTEQKSPPTTPQGQASAQWSPQLSQGLLSTQSSHLNGSNTQPTRKGSIAIGNSLLHDVMDFGSTLRRDSVGSQEAPQIETKRNVGGDLYMKNQSAIEAFKDIQKSDKKRRKSSIFASLSRSSSVSTGGKQSKAVGDSPTSANLMTPIPIISNIDSSSKIKVGPISIDSNRRSSSVISLPLTESFASLDSFNDEYLTSKYQEFRKKKHAMTFLNDHTTQSDSALPKEMDTFHGMSDKFKNFNLGYSMSREGSSSHSRPESNRDGIAPREAKKTFINLHDSSDSDSDTSDSSSSSSSIEKEERGNLTLKFNSKVAPRSRPPFLTLSNRAFSHDSNLTDLAHSPKVNYYTPYSFQGSLDELEDVPESLMGEDTESLSEGGPKLEATLKDSNSKPAFPMINEFLKSKIVQNNPAQSSPLRTEIVETPDGSKADSVMQVDLEKHLSRKASEGRNSIIDGGYFNNHYKKEHVASPLPFSKHLDADKESESKQQAKGSLGLDVRPFYNRSNSITLGLLQHEPSDLE